MAARGFIARCNGRIDFTNMLIAFLTLKTFVARNGPVEHYFVANLKVGYIGADLGYDASPFVAHYDGFTPRLRIPVGMTDTRRFDFYQYFIALRGGYMERLNGKMAVTIGDGGFGVNHVESNFYHKGTKF